MRSKLSLIALAGALAGCQTSTAADIADRGLASVNEPVLVRSNFAIDMQAPGGMLPPEEIARLDGWFQGMELGYGDAIYVDGGYSDPARAQVAELAGRYGIMVQQAAPVTAGAVAPGAVRVVVSRNRAEVPGCPNWSTPSQPNYANRSMPNFGCGVNGSLAMQVANPQDLFHGQESPTAVDAIAGAKAIQMYRDWPLTGIKPGQELRPLRENLTRKED